ncbi:probable DNA mismatch repair protein Msh6 [Chelonus insularis]|uniref:probable DNA mismatch repair protein Msh6 n=1 Tax=Chelonus insularis TaxID=460826 RepID=UPI00158CCE4A|nr:probable DNA mismatch repair protein Msh6 [Chelonus insularis]
MSKRSQKNTLLNYFTSPPGVKRDAKPEAKATASPKASTPTRRKAKETKGKANDKENKKDNKKQMGTPKRKRPVKGAAQNAEADNDDEDEDKEEEDETEVKAKKRKVAQEKSEKKQNEKLDKKKAEKAEDSDDEKNEEDNTNVITTKRGRVVKQKKLFDDSKLDEDDTDDEMWTKKKPEVPAGKKRRIIIPDDDSEGGTEDEYKPDADETISEESDVSDENVSAELAETPSEDSASDVEPTPPKKKSNGFFPGKAKNSNKSKDKDDLQSFTLEKQMSSGPDNGETWEHLKFDFLKPENIRDANKRRPDDPEYNPRTLYVPPDFLNTQTPAIRQWWVLKSKYFDCIFFFKVGKFYELYHMDAVTGVNVLGLTFMRGQRAHSGFPEISYGRYSSALVEKGYKVARIEQTENPEMMAKRCEKQAKVSKFDKVVRREICQVSTRGTRIPTVRDTESFAPQCNYIMSIVEKQNAKQLSTYGICYVDTSIGLFHMGQFDDDHHNSRLLTLFSHSTPAHLIYEKGNLSSATMKILNTQLPVSTIKEGLLKDTEFLSATNVLEKLHEGEYFKSNSEFSWPDGLKPFLNEKDTLGLTPADDKQLAVHALGGIVHILCSYVLDEQVLGQKRFQTYTPPDLSHATGLSATMVLDAVAINNLNVLGNAPSLISTLDYCCTPFGKRLLRDWVCRPAGDKNVIHSRQEAISELRDVNHVVQEAKELLSSLPDLERLLSKVHAHGNAAIAENHPDSRAFMFEPTTYSKRKITDFIMTLEGFDNILKIMKLFESFESDLIIKTTQTEPQGEFPKLREILNLFKNGFNHEEALKEGCIVPSRGIDSEYDAVMDEFDKIKKDTAEYLKEQCKYFGCTVKFTGNGKNRYQLEVPDSHAKKADENYDHQGQRKGFKRYWTPEALKLLSRTKEAEDQRDKILKDSDRRTFAKFSENYDMWSLAVYKVAVLDVLISLAEHAKTGDMCIPEIQDNSNEIMITIKEGKHPFILDDNFVPNDTSLAANGYGPLIILTGPNMGGKSTIMRQVGLLMIMSHIGCHIPAESCKFSLVDRVFTRLGANDDMVTARSTFLVELSEAVTIVQHATKHSLVLVDELGRGTSTHDGTAIAASILNTLAQIKCRTIFSTHYHSLVDDFKEVSDISVAHMACLVESEENDESQETVTFLYKLTEGACPKSYGFNAARIAGIKADITKRANELASQLEQAGKRRNLFISLCQSNNSNVKSILTQLQAIKIK